MQSVTYLRKTIDKQLFSMVLIVCGLAAAGCTTSPDLVTRAPSQISLVPRCPAGSAKICHVHWASKIQRNQRDYNCNCVTL